MGIEGSIVLSNNSDVNTFEFIHEFWPIPTANIANYTNMVIGKYEIQTFELLVVVLLLLLLLLFDVFVPTSAHPLSFLDKSFVQIYLSIYLNYNLAIAVKITI